MSNILSLDDLLFSRLSVVRRLQGVQFKLLLSYS